MDISPQNDDQRWELVLAPDTSAKELVELLNGVDSSDRTMRRAIAEHANCPVDLLIAFSTDSDVMVRRGAAFNPQMPIEQLHLLAEDHDWLVRIAVSGNHMYPKKWLFEKLLFDTDHDVRNSACEYCNELSQSDWLNIVKDGVSLGMQISYQQLDCLLGDLLIQHNHVAIYQSIQSAEFAHRVNENSQNIRLVNAQDLGKKLRM